MSRVWRSSVSSSRAASAGTSPKAKLSKYSISSGSDRARVEARSPNSWSWWLFAAALIATRLHPRHAVRAQVLLVGDPLEPGRGLSVAGGVEDRVMAHHVLSGAAMEMLLARRGPHALAGAQHDGLPVAGADQPDAVSAHQQLPVDVTVPIGARAGGEPDEAASELRGAVAAEHRVHPPVAGEVRRRRLHRGGAGILVHVMSFSSLR